MGGSSPFNVSTTRTGRNTPRQGISQRVIAPSPPASNQRRGLWPTVWASVFGWGTSAAGEGSDLGSSMQRNRQASHASAFTDAEDKDAPSAEAHHQSPSSPAPVARTLTSSRAPVDIRQIFARASWRTAFEHHLAKEYAAESITFWVEAQNYRKAYSDMTSATRRARAINLLRVFFDLENGSLTVNVGHRVTSRMHDVMRAVGADGNPPLALFDEAMREIVDMLERDAFLRFIKSDAYRAIVDEAASVASPCSASTGM